MKKILLIVILTCITFYCQANQNRVIVGAEQTNVYLPLLKNKRIAIFSNHTGMIGNKHLLDVLLENKINVVAIFSPEHGFRGNADAGEHVSSSVDSKTGVPILSLYDGKLGRPSEIRPADSRHTRCRIKILYLLCIHGPLDGCMCRV